MKDTVTVGATDDLYNGISRAFPLQLFPWDEYFCRMAEADFKLNRHATRVVKSYFVRKAPFGGSHILLGGLTAALRLVKELPLDSEEFAEGLRSRGYDGPFIKYLAELRNLGKDVTIYAPKEGTPFFPNEPIVSIEAPIIQSRLIDGLMIAEMNYPSLSLTKWNRLVRTVRPGNTMEFARRRAQDYMRTTLYAMLAGCFATSNSEFGRCFAASIKGTMGHEWMQSFAELWQAFNDWLKVQPGLPIGLVDTVHCMEKDFPMWLEAVFANRDAIKAADSPVWGWRNDSGDLAYLVIEQYIRFLKHKLAQDPWFFERMRIWLTNELDEYVATSIIGQITTQAGQAGFDHVDILRRIIWAAGTRPGVAIDDPSIAGVMKMMEVDGKPCIKLALDAEGRVGPKTSIPGFNRSAFVYRGEENLGVLIFPHRRYCIKDGKLFDRNKNHSVEELHMCHPDNSTLVRKVEDYRIEMRQGVIFENGDFTDAWTKDRPTLSSVPEYIQKSVDALHWSYTRIDKPHVFPVSVTPDLFRLREKMIQTGALQSEYSLF